MTSKHKQDYSPLVLSTESHGWPAGGVLFSGDVWSPWITTTAGFCFASRPRGLVCSCYVMTGGIVTWTTIWWAPSTMSYGRLVIHNKLDQCQGYFTNEYSDTWVWYSDGKWSCLSKKSDLQFSEIYTVSNQQGKQALQTQGMCLCVCHEWELGRLLHLCLSFLITLNCHLCLGRSMFFNLEKLQS